MIHTLYCIYIVDWETATLMLAMIYTYMFKIFLEEAGRFENKVRKLKLKICKNYVVNVSALFSKNVSI